MQAAREAGVERNASTISNSWGLPPITMKLRWGRSRSPAPFGTLPSGGIFFGGWSARARAAVPGTEQLVQRDQFRPQLLGAAEHDDSEHDHQRIYLSQRGQLRLTRHSFGMAAPTNYGWCMGDWFVWGGVNGTDNRSALQFNRPRRIADFTDGTSNSLLAAEVKAQQRYLRDFSSGLANIQNPSGRPRPQRRSLRRGPEYNSGGSLQASGHTEWVDGHVHQSGMTTAWPPN